MEPGLAAPAVLRCACLRQQELEAEAALLRKYGGLPRANPIFAHSLKSQKQYFDSGDYSMQQQGALHEPGQARGGEAGPVQAGSEGRGCSGAGEGLAARCCAAVH